MNAPRLTTQFEAALVYATRLHSHQTRKIRQIPYIAHLLSVAALVLEAGGDEDEAIAALLHDAVEDQGGIPTRNEIHQRFGDRVVAIVNGCTEFDTLPKPSWQERKTRYLENLRHASPAVRRVSLADKLHNARSLLAEWRQKGDTIWTQFTKGKEGTLWFYRSLIQVYRETGSDFMTEELDRVVSELCQDKKLYYTPEEYLELEDAAEYKSEYRDGNIVPMTGETTNHNKIAGNFCANLKFALKRQNYDVYIGNVRLWIPRHRQYTYPDVMVIQGEPVYTGTSTTTVMNPLLIVEVLSKSTKNYDQGDKFLYYRSIPELKEYILIDQEQYHVIQHTKTPEGKWLLTEYESQEALLALKSINFKIAFSDLYERVDFAESED